MAFPENFPITNKWVHELANIIELHEIKGVCPIDFVHGYKLRKGQSLILNLDTSDEPGSHYVTLFCKGNNKFSYFDPLGIPPMDLNLQEFFENIQKRVKKSKNQVIVEDMETCVQSPLSFFCGLFCIAFVIAQKQNLSNDYFFNMFFTPPKKLAPNDSLVIEFISSYVQNNIRLTKQKKFFEMIIPLQNFALHFLNSVLKSPYATLNNLYEKNQKITIENKN